jgi:serine/threonine-protein kinase RsbW
VVKECISQKFPGCYQSLAKIAELVRCACAQTGFDSCTTYSVETAVDEACSNIIEHAYGGEDIGDIQCTYRIEEKGLVIILQDTGCTFNPDDVPSANLQTPLKRLKNQGLGLYFIHKIMDEVHFESSPETGNSLTLIKNKPTSSTPDPAG